MFVCDSISLHWTRSWQILSHLICVWFVTHCQDQTSVPVPVPTHALLAPPPLAPRQYLKTELMILRVLPTITLAAMLICHADISSDMSWQHALLICHVICHVGINLNLCSSPRGWITKFEFLPSHLNVLRLWPLIVVDCRCHVVLLLFFLVVAFFSTLLLLFVCLQAFLQACMKHLNGRSIT